MVYVITDSCTSTCDTACTEVCPVDCIVGPRPVEEIRDLPPSERQGLRMFINPDDCIGCGACMPMCPVDAIVDEDDATPEERETNAAFFRK